MYDNLSQKEKDEIREKLAKDLVFYLNNYKGLTDTRPRFKKVVDKEINELTKQLKALSK